MAQAQPLKKVEKRFKAKVQKPEDFLVSENINGFDFLNVPIILDSSPDIITTNYHWGLVPSWSKDIDFRKNTLNARIETISEKPSFKSLTHQRCLVIASSFFEWHWNDAKGKSKDKYQIFSGEDEIFAMAGLYTSWTNPSTGDLYNSFSIVTTAANKQMEYIHNHKKRMPIMLKKGDEMAWLDSKSNIDEFAFPYESSMVAFRV
ncbi:SOS response-associated peptidase [Flavobacterium sp. SUN046]|uniref:SOS response-associated peptidase n=1 Tax=Flavobacterium sp. SUN046 TaxID=3002440 RepID=UPI002DBBA9BF|nr:SOS response-associated peptidase [Flavobacterium sp. SUN046]MEC4048748.1 SOS response-associated peptidase [Flavobacterium sp. SUN046]